MVLSIDVERERIPRRKQLEGDPYTSYVSRTKNPIVTEP